ncbi:MAG: hypothetical protein ACIPMY_06670 [Rickettsia endosymbiont of Pentastiridius leporinus]
MNQNNKQKTINIEITEFLARELITEQFPNWSHLPIKTVELSGHDNGAVER